MAFDVNKMETLKVEPNRKEAYYDTNVKK